MLCSMTVTILHLLRVVLETHVGNLFRIKQNGSGQIYDSFEGGIVALLEALYFADANRWDQVVLEFNSSTLVQALFSPGHGDSEFYVIVSSIIY